MAEAVDILAALAPDITATIRSAARKAFVILDGTPLPIDRIATDRRYYSGCEDVGVSPRSRFDPYSGWPSVPCV
ncbi:hypothetical protein BC739_000750 [Kutzneria viridogrisea]|uniref:Uncharacterized protein n=1 Tax=Kutzneria viridogrisea TaxID=47990 RepID=A0ABR6B9L9_9PSEU|nr:hypothetical protein [Kutzneria viridogrisea]